MTNLASLQAPERSSKKDSVLSTSSHTIAAIPIDGRPYLNPSSSEASADDLKRTRVTGGPFVVSASIVAACKDPGLMAVHFCKGLYEDLKKLAREPRDFAWAATMEEKLQAFVEQDFKESSIRNIECRTTWCALEVISGDHKFLGGFGYPNPLSDQLHNQNWVVSSEKDPLGADIQVILVTYKRK